MEKELQVLSDSVTNVRLDIRELMTEVRSLKDLQRTVNQQELRVTTLEGEIVATTGRLDKIDRFFWFIMTTVLTTLIMAILSLVISKGGTPHIG